MYTNNFFLGDNPHRRLVIMFSFLTLQISTNVQQALPSVTIMPHASTSQALSAAFVTQVTQEMV